MADTTFATVLPPLKAVDFGDTTYGMAMAERHVVVEVPFTGSGNLVVGTHKATPGANFKLIAIELHLSAAPTTAAQNLVLTKDDGVAPAYDLNILTIDLVANAVVNVVVKPDMLCKSTDVITAAWTNTDARTYGLTFKYEKV